MGSKSWIGAMTVGLIWLWMVRIPNSEVTMDYVKHIDLNERRDAMRQWGVFPAHPADWQKANLAKLGKKQFISSRFTSTSSLTQTLRSTIIDHILKTFSSNISIHCYPFVSLKPKKNLIKKITDL